jgi:hypothetical protein
MKTRTSFIHELDMIITNGLKRILYSSSKSTISDDEFRLIFETLLRTINPSWIGDGFHKSKYVTIFRAFSLSRYFFSFGLGLITELLHEKFNFHVSAMIEQSKELIGLLLHPNEVDEMNVTTNFILRQEVTRSHPLNNIEYVKKTVSFLKINETFFHCEEHENEFENVGGLSVIMQCTSETFPLIFNNKEYVLNFPKQPKYRIYSTHEEDEFVAKKLVKQEEILYTLEDECNNLDKMRSMFRRLCRYMNIWFPQATRLVHV